MSRLVLITELCPVCGGLAMVVSRPPPVTRIWLLIDCPACTSAADLYESLEIFE